LKGKKNRGGGKEHSSCQIGRKPIWEREWGGGAVRSREEDGQRGEKKVIRRYCRAGKGGGNLLIDSNGERELEGSVRYQSSVRTLKVGSRLSY